VNSVFPWERCNFIPWNVFRLPLNPAWCDTSLVFKKKCVLSVCDPKCTTWHHVVKGMTVNMLWPHAHKTLFKHCTRSWVLSHVSPCFCLCGFPLCPKLSFSWQETEVNHMGYVQPQFFLNDIKMYCWAIRPSTLAPSRNLKGTILLIGVLITFF
jgi:hypothetical protein